MKQLIGVALAAFVVGCTAPRSVDGGSGGAGGTTDAGTTDAGTVDAGPVDAGTVDAGTVDAGTMDAGTTDAGTTDAGSTDGGSGTLTGELAFNVVTIAIGGYALDGGAEYSGVNIVWFDGALGGSGCEAALQGPLKTMRVQLSSLDGGALLPGVYTVGTTTDSDVSGLRQDVDAQNQASVLAQLELGTVTLTRLDTTSAGTFIGTLIHVDGGTSPLSGTWEGSVCKL